MAGQDERINKSGELRRARTLSFKMKLRAKYMGYELTQRQQKLAIENIYILELCQIVYKPSEPENAMLLHKKKFFSRFMQYDKFLDVKIEPWWLQRFTISMSFL